MYNGWMNYETWLMMESFHKNKELWDKIVELGHKSCQAGSVAYGWDDPICLLAEEIEYLVMNSRPELDDAIFDGLLKHSLSLIDYFQIAETVLDTI